MWQGASLSAFGEGACDAPAIRESGPWIPQGECAEKRHLKERQGFDHFPKSLSA